MKKTLLLFVLFIVLAFGGCTPAASKPSELLPSDQASEPTPELGSEENPMKTGETFLGVYTDGDGKSQYNIGISLQEVVRGSQAMDVLREAHVLNPKPEEGKEYIIARFQVRYISDATDGNPPLYLNKFNFAFRSLNNSSIYYLTSLSKLFSMKLVSKLPFTYSLECKIKYCNS